MRVSLDPDVFSGGVRVEEDPEPVQTGLALVG
jgi:hypothetical protein